MSAPRPVLLTGASGRLGHGLAARLAAAGVALRLTDRHPFPGPLPPGASFTQQDLGDAAAIAELAAGCGTILHFGGVPNEVPGFESILDANLRGCFHVYEAARMAGARVVFASSNHAFGFHPRPGEAAARLEADCAYRPDTFYGLSKVYGEQMGRLYWDKHAVESVQLRIGSCTETPQDARALATWFSHGDLARCCLAAIAAPRTGWAVIWGASANPASFWGGDDRGLLAWEPQDSAEAWRAEIAGRVSADPLVERFQGGAFCALDWPPGRPRG